MLRSGKSIRTLKSELHFPMYAGCRLLWLGSNYSCIDLSLSITTLMPSQNICLLSTDIHGWLPMPRMYHLFCRSSSMQWTSSIGASINMKGRITVNRRWTANILAPWRAADALPSLEVNPLEGSPKCSCGKRDSERRSRLPTLKRGRGSSWEPRD
jgi:hypothetical protein